MKRSHVVPCLLLLLGAASTTAYGEVTVSPTSVSLSAQVNGTPVNSTLTLTPVGAASASYLIQVVPAVSWLSVSPAADTAPKNVVLTATPNTLAAGTYNTTLQIYSSNSTGAPVNVPVTFIVSNLGVSPSQVIFNYTIGGSLPGAQAISLTSTVSTNFTAAATTTTGGNWLQVAPTSGTTPTSVTAQVNSAVVVGLAAGTYNGGITITPTSGAISGAITIPVTLTVAAPAQVTVSPTAMNFGYQIGGTGNVTSQTLTLTTTSTTAVNYGFAVQVDPNPAGLNWLTVNPTGGAIPANGNAQATVAVAPGSLPAGTYNGKLTVFAPGASPAQQDIAVRLTVSTVPLLNVNPAALTFTYQIGTTTPAAQNLTPTSTGAALSYGVSASTTSGGSWLQANASGTTPTPFPVSVNPAGLPVGTYTGTVTVNAPGAANSPVQISVTLKVSNDPVVTASASSMSFVYQLGQAAPALQSVKVSSTTGATLNYTVTATPSWLILGGQTSGSTDGIFTVAANVTGQAAGTYEGTITINATVPSTGAATINSPLTIPVKLYVSNNPLLIVGTTSLAFSAQVGGTPPAAQTITVSSTGSPDSLAFSVTFSTDTGGNWLFVGPLNGFTPNTLVVSVVPSLLSTGTYTGKITLSAAGPGGAVAANTPLVIPVTLSVTQGTLSATPTTLAFAQTLGGAAPASQTIQVTSSGTAANYTVATSTGAISVPWLSATPTNGTTPGIVTVSVDGSKLTAGTYQGAVTVTAPGTAGSPFNIPVTFTVSAGSISATPTSLTFTGSAGSTTIPSQSINVTSSSGTLGFTTTAATTSGGNWLGVNNSSGTTPGSVSVTVNASGLAAGTYQGSITITSPGATGSPITIPVTLTLGAPQTITLTPTSLTFSYTTGSAAPQSQTVQIATSGGASPFTASVTTSSGGNWLNIAPTSGSTPATLTVSVAPQNITTAGNYTGTVTVNSPNAAQSQTVTVTLTVQTIPPPSATTVVNSATFAPGAVSPGELITLGGTGLGPAGNPVVAGPDSSGFYPTTFNDTQVTFDGIPAAIYYVSATQSSVFVPYNVAGRVSTNMVVTYKGVASTALQLRVVDASPGIYTVNQSGSGPGVIQNQDYQVNSSNRPAAKGSYVTVWCTGEGQTSPAGVNGQVIPADLSRAKKPVLPVSATIGGRPATVYYAGSALGLVSGVFQVILIVPNDAPSGGNVPVTITVGSFTTQTGVTMAVQ